jgi:hypothetical protein
LLRLLLLLCILPKESRALLSRLGLWFLAKYRASSLALDLCVGIESSKQASSRLGRLSLCISKAEGHRDKSGRCWPGIERSRLEAGKAAARVFVYL